MREKIGDLLGGLSILLLMAGFLGSQYAAMNGAYAAYAEKTDAFPIRMLALVILVVAVVLGFAPKHEDRE